jgi:hypothetical protein
MPPEVAATVTALAEQVLSCCLQDKRPGERQQSDEFCEDFRRALPPPVREWIPVRRQPLPPLMALPRHLLRRDLSQRE